VQSLTNILKWNTLNHLAGHANSIKLSGWFNQIFILYAVHIFFLFFINVNVSAFQFYIEQLPEINEVIFTHCS
jgi:hypothetical protein